MRRTMWVGILAGVALAMCAPAPAGAVVILGADATTESGAIALLVIGTGFFTKVDLYEREGDAVTLLRTVEPPQIPGSPDGEPRSGGYFPRVTPWSCDRLSRSFLAAAYRADGTVETSAFALRTPSCRDRLTLTTPRSARRGARVRVVVRDRWRAGEASATLCHRAPGAGRRCRTLRLGAGGRAATFVYGMHRKGHWEVELRSSHQRLRRTVSVDVPPVEEAPRLPVVLTTGDSLMQSVDARLGDQLAHRAQVRSDVRIGSGLSKLFPVDWRTLPRRQVGRYHPDASVVFLGTNDGGLPMTTPDGTRLNCCAEPWIAEYARRARRAMRAYLRRRHGVVVWLNIPAARDPRRAVPDAAINVALDRAAAGLPRAAVLDMAGLFTPAGRYRDFMTYRGRRVRVRQGDGVHLSLAGAAIAAHVVTRQLRRFGVL